MKKTILSLAMLLLASAGFAQCGKNAGYEVKAENAYTCLLYTSDAADE